MIQIDIGRRVRVLSLGLVAENPKMKTALQHLINPRQTYSIVWFPSALRILLVIDIL